MEPASPSPHERAAALLRRQQSTTARLRAGLPDLLGQLDGLDEPGLPDVEMFQMRVVDPPGQTGIDVTPDDADGATGDATT
jgi:hypothetical protein